MKVRAVAAIFLGCVLSVAPATGADYGVYVQAVEQAEGSFDDIVGKNTAALEKAGWQIAKSYAAAVPQDCGFRAHTLVLDNIEYAQKILDRGPSGAFVLPLRVSVFEDEKGIQVSFANPLSLSRTVLGEGIADSLASKTAAEIAVILAGASGGTAVNRPLGQLRSKGRVGGMGGGDFEDKLEVLFDQEASQSPLEEVADSVRQGIRADEEGWELAYSLEYIPQGVVILGVNKASMEAKAYAIAGEKRKGPKNSCPGIDHAAAFPIEVVVFQTGPTVKVAILDEMYRMKVYFEDAGKWAFAKNMRMPGKIEKEIVRMVLSQLRK